MKTIAVDINLLPPGVRVDIFSYIDRGSSPRLSGRLCYSGEIIASAALIDALKKNINAKSTVGYKQYRTLTCSLLGLEWDALLGRILPRFGELPN